MEKQMNGSQTFQKHVPDLGHHNLEKKIKDIHFTVENYWSLIILSQTME